MRIHVDGNPADADIIESLLSPWNISMTGLEKADVVVSYRKRPLKTHSSIVIPSDSPDFLTWANEAGLRVKIGAGLAFLADTGSNVFLRMVPRRTYSCGQSVVECGKESRSPYAAIGENRIILSVDVVNEYSGILSRTLEARPTLPYRFLTSGPFYRIAPKSLKDLFMRKKRTLDDMVLCDKLSLDALRFVLARAVETISCRELKRKEWYGGRHVYVITHDIDTRKGLGRAASVKRLEERYDIPSTWYVPSKLFQLDLAVLRQLCTYGEVGAHGARHEGNLAELPERKLVKKLRDAKQILEKATARTVEGFRAPLLQHSRRILRGLKEAGYNYDTSIPTWEPRHPRTMQSHGLGTVYPMLLGNLVEIPVSVVQDHQLLHVVGSRPRDVYATWLSMISVIRRLAGCSVLLSHPEYRLFDEENLSLYEEFLNTIRSDRQAWVTTSSCLAEGIDR